MANEMTGETAQQTATEPAYAEGDPVLVHGRCVCNGPNCYERCIGAATILRWRPDKNCYEVCTANLLYMDLRPSAIIRKLTLPDPMICMTGALVAVGGGRSLPWAAEIACWRAKATGERNE